MVQGEDLPPHVLQRRLAYAGFVLVAYELVKSMIVGPIKAFYADMTFGQGMPFKSYDVDVRTRHRNEFEACLLYLRDFMEAVDADDVKTIQDLREHRNELAHSLASKLPILRLGDYRTLWDKVDRTLFKLSNYRAFMEVGADPEFLGIDWDTAKGGEYLLFERVFEAVRFLNQESDAGGPYEDRAVGQR
jgi:hypothetical protein